MSATFKTSTAVLLSDTGLENSLQHFVRILYSDLHYINVSELKVLKVLSSKKTSFKKNLNSVYNALIKRNVDIIVFDN